MDWSILSFRYQGLNTIQTPGKNVDTAQKKNTSTNTGICNGVSANSWLSDIGKNKSSMTNHCVVNLHEQCQKSIKERAISGSGLLGRRHFEQQQLTTADIFIGKDISPLIDIRSSSSPRKGEGVDNNEQSQNDRFENGNIEKREGKRRGSRPRTSGAKIGNIRDFPKRPYTAPLFAKTSYNDTEQPLLIKQLINCDSPATDTGQKYNYRGETDQSIDSRRTNASVWLASRKCRPPQQNSEQPEHGKFGGSLVQEGESNFPKSKNQQSKQSSPNKQDELVVDSRKTLHKKEMEKSRIVNIVPRNRFETCESPVQRPLSSWRPLLYSAEHDIQHGAGCTYQCQGCFKACLASEDYLESAQTAYKERNSRNSKKELILALKRNKTISQEVKRERYCEDLDEMGTDKPQNFLNLKKLEKNLIAE